LGARPRRRARRRDRGGRQAMNKARKNRMIDVLEILRFQVAFENGVLDRSLSASLAPTLRACERLSKLYFERQTQEARWPRASTIEHETRAAGIGRSPA